MAQIILNLGVNVRNYSKKLRGFSILGNTTSTNIGGLNNGIATRSPKSFLNKPEWEFTPTTGLQSYFKKHDNFKDQERHNRMARGFILRQGSDIKYYTTTFNPENDPLFHEDNARTIDRVFNVPVILSFQPENELYAKFGIQQLDQDEIHIHMGLFLELNYQSLRNMGVVPKDDSTTHNPIFSQRGYESFRYYGYTSEQIFPKPGDKIKIEAFNTLYEVESVKDASPQFQHRWRKYFWKVYMKAAQDLGQTVSTDVLDDPEQQKFINDLLNLQSGDILDTDGSVKEYPFDVSKTVDKLKKDVLFHPPEVQKDVEDVSEDSNFTPGGDSLGRW